MKRSLLSFGLLLGISVAAQTGYEIKVTFKPFRNQYIYLGHYFGKQYPIIDSALLNDKSEAVFKGPARLPGGIYLVGYPRKTGFFEILVDQQQHFSVIADTTNIRTGIEFTGSSDNNLFKDYQKYMLEKGEIIHTAQQHLKQAANANDSAQWNQVLIDLDKTVRAYREDLIQKNPGNILSVLLVTMREPILPAHL